MTPAADGQSGAAIEAIGTETRTFPPPSDFRSQALTSDRSLYEEAERRPRWGSGSARPVSW